MLKCMNFRVPLEDFYVPVEDVVVNCMHFCARIEVLSVGIEGFGLD